jgi:protein-disulfide isomerase
MGGIVVILLALMVWTVKGSGTKPVFEVGVINALDNTAGNLQSKVIVVQYSDFQCPACRTYYMVMRQLMVEFNDKVAFVYRYFPLSNIHPNADFAARAAQVASKQGKFWEMHNLLFEKQDEWAKVSNIEPVFESYATLLGLDVEKFKTDFLSQEVKDLVESQKENALKLGLQGTPTFFVNGEQIQNPTSVEAFRVIINDALKNK